MRKMDKEKEREYAKKYYQAHKEHLKDASIIRMRKYRETHREQINDRQKRYYQAHREYAKEYRMKHGQTHREQEREYYTKYHQLHREQRKEFSKAYNHTQQGRESQKAYRQTQRYKERIKGRQKLRYLTRHYVPLGSDCELCPSEDVRTIGLEHHHPDYDFPLVTVTVCRECHGWLRLGLLSEYRSKVVEVICLDQKTMKSHKYHSVS